MSLVVTKCTTKEYSRYHLSHDDNTSRGICGAETAPTDINLVDWNTSTEYDWTQYPVWCKTCTMLKHRHVKVED
jgi:hypothetical protein